MASTGSVDQVKQSQQAQKMGGVTVNGLDHHQLLGLVRSQSRPFNMTLEGGRGRMRAILQREMAPSPLVSLPSLLETDQKSKICTYTMVYEDAHMYEFQDTRTATGYIYIYIPRLFYYIISVNLTNLTLFFVNLTRVHRITYTHTEDTLIFCK